MARMIDADAMLAELKPITYEMEHTSVLVSDMSNIMRNWVERQPTLTQPNETPPCYQPDGDGCAYQCYDGQDEPIEKCKACPLCCSDKQRHYTQPNEPERAGLYGKYTVYKNKDGSLVTGCFVLRPEKDPAAVAALRAYAATTDNAELADDIINWVGVEPNEPLTREELREMGKEQVWVKCLKPNKYINPPTGWRILEKSLTGTFGVWDGEDSLIERHYGTDWLAYRRPPEGEA